MRSALGLLVLCLVIHGGWSCTCFGNHIQNRICSGAVVFRGTVSSVASAGQAYRVNNVLIEEVFQDLSGNLEAGSSVHVWTADQPSLCAIRLSVGASYLMDTSDDGRLQMNGCHMTRQWPSDQDEEAALRKTLSSDADCACRVKVCEHPMMGPDRYFQCLMTPPDVGECVMDAYGAYSEQANCGTDYSACKRTSSAGPCSWKPTLPAGCLENLIPKPPAPRY